MPDDPCEANAVPSSMGRHLSVKRCLIIAWALRRAGRHR